MTLREFDPLVSGQGFVVEKSDTLKETEGSAGWRSVSKATGRKEKVSLKFGNCYLIFEILYVGSWKINLWNDI
jgi:hypothetical protein